jgi:hypothetical protein
VILPKWPLTLEILERVFINYVPVTTRKLSAANPSINYANALEKRHEGTGLWLTEGQTFSNWEKRSKSFLWLHGIPGCGKTVLSSIIIEHLKSATTPDQALLYFYFHFNDAKKQTLEDMLRSLVNQLYQAQPATRGSLNQLWESARKGNQQLSKKLLKDILLVMLSKINGVSIVLDALDESTTRSDLLAWLRGVAEIESVACRVLVTSRGEEDIESVLQRWMQPEDKINIQEDDVSKDIQSYVSHTVRNSDRLARWYEKPEVQNEIEMELVKRADGM